MSELWELSIAFYREMWSPYVCLCGSCKIAYSRWQCFSGTDFSSAKAVLQFMQIYTHVYHWNWDAWICIWMWHMKGFICTCVFFVKKWGLKEKKLLQPLHSLQWGGEAVLFMCQDAEELGSTDACGEHQGSLFPFFFANKFEEILSLPPPRGDRVLLHLHTGCCLKSAVLF